MEINDIYNIFLLKIFKIYACSQSLASACIFLSMNFDKNSMPSAFVFVQVVFSYQLFIDFLPLTNYIRDANCLIQPLCPDSSISYIAHKLPCYLTTIKVLLY